MKKKGIGTTLLIASSTLILGVPAFFTSVPVAHSQEASAQTDNNIRAAVLNTLKNSAYKNVTVTVKGGIVDLEGTVPDFATKEEADKRTHRIKNVVAVRNKIQVAGAGTISDQELQRKILGRIQYDRVGYGQAFSAISVSVQNGVVTLAGHAVGPVAADDAVNIASRTPGALDVINNIQVDPLSPMDNRIRLQVYRAVYGFPALNKYAIDPVQPIRITVVNGHVILSGIVISEADKNIAGIRANSVPGVFSVTNDLQVAGAANEKK